MTRKLLFLLVPVAFAAVSSPAFGIQILTIGSTGFENFDTLAATGTSSVLPAGWAFSESGTGANTTYDTGTGSSRTGNTYSFGAAGSTDRALGGLQSGSLIPLFGVNITTPTGATLTSLAISYMGEQWRLGAATGREDRLDFQFSLDATSVDNGTWANLDSLDFVGSITSGSTGALDGNGNAIAISGEVSGLSLTDGSSIWLRWLDFNATGSDDGLAIDDFSVIARAAASTVTPTPIDDSASSLGLLGLALVSMALVTRRRLRG
jgi:hypothetical protein